jgi:putative restriction endonuclease
VLSADELGTPGSLIQLVELVDGGRLSDELWQLLQDQEARDMLRREILRAYFPSAARERGVLGDAEADILAEEAKLIDEAEAQFKKIRRRSGIENDYGYNRHLLFPRVVKGLYGGACALCRLDVKIPPAASLVDGAHILPFAKYHNDDPRNGIALCKNHHWGFDAGWFGITDDYRVIVSPKVTANRRFVENGASVLIPANRSLAPAIEALRWHRENLVMKD